MNKLRDQLNRLNTADTLDVRDKKNVAANNRNLLSMQGSKERCGGAVYHAEVSVDGPRNNFMLVKSDESKSRSPPRYATGPKQAPQYITLSN